MEGKAGDGLQEWLVGVRRDFHRQPELAYQEHRTAGRIGEILGELGIEFRPRVAGTGLVAWLQASRSGPTVALRADMDALPLTERTGLPYASVNPGVMHACGHDAHMTIALGVLKKLIDERWPELGQGRILVIFQPAEEGGAGARAMLESGVFERERVAAVFAGHMHPERPVGQIGLTPGVSNAASDTFAIRLSGKGGHGAYPHLCADPIVAGAHLVTHLQTIVSRSLSPVDRAVVTIGRFQAGTASNIIPEEAFLQGTLRTLSDGTRRVAIERLHAMVEALDLAFRVRGRLEIGEGYPPVRNAPELVAYCRERAGVLFGVESVHAEEVRMGAEDFAFFLRQWPGVLVRLGCHDPAKGYCHGLHSPHFELDERVLEFAVRLFADLLTGFAEARDGSVGGSPGSALEA